MVISSPPLIKSVQFALRADFDVLIHHQLQLSSFVLEKPSLVGSIGVAELTFVYQDKENVALYGLL